MTNSTLDAILQDPDDDSGTVPVGFLGFGLTLRQKRLADGYLSHGNGTRAARDAGYSGDAATLCQQAWRVLRYANVRAYLAAQLGASEITPAMIRGMLANEAIGAESDGARVRAQELLGKTQGMFSDALDIRSGGAVDDVSLVRKIARGDPRLEAILLARLRGEDDPQAMLADKSKDSQ